MTGVVRTVLGDRDADTLGVTDSHDHVFFASQALPGHELDDPAAARDEVQAFLAVGGQTIVQWTPRGLGRDRAALAEISRATGVTVLSATGRHRREHHEGAVEPVDQLTAAFVDDLVAVEQPCGLIKIGTGFHHLDAYERDSLTAAALAHHRTGAPIAVHLELGTAGDLVLQFLRDAHVPPSAVVLGHVGRNPEDGYLAELAASGAFLCFDGPSRANHRTDWRTPACIERLAGDHLDQLLIGGDTTTAAARSVRSGPGMPGLLIRFGDHLRRSLGDAAYRAIVVANPARAFALRPRGDVAAATAQ